MRGILCIFMLSSLCGIHSFYYKHNPVTYCLALDANRTDRKCMSQVKLYANRLTSTHNFIPYGYNRFDFCKSTERTDHSTQENLGQAVFGERIHPLPLQFVFGKDSKECQPLCVKTYKTGNVNDRRKLHFLQKAIHDNYLHHLTVDNVPITWCLEIEQAARKFCSTGIPIGCWISPEEEAKDACVTFKNLFKPDTYYLFNHMSIVIEYSDTHGEDEWTGARLLSAKIEPKSVKHEIDASGKITGCTSDLMSIEEATDELKIGYTYDIKFKVNNMKRWSSRWDYILESVPHAKIHWFHIGNSVIIVILLLGAIILNLRRDIARYNQHPKSQEEGQEEFGWKLVHGDVFRPPRAGMFLSVCVGMGTQIGIMVFVTLVIACFGFLSPGNDGALSTCIIVLSVLLAPVGSYVSARIYKTIGGKQWIYATLLTALLIPGFVFVMWFMLNLVHWSKESSASVPWAILMVLLWFWIGLYVPLTFCGAYLGYKKTRYEVPMEVNQIPRAIPNTKSFAKPLPCIVIGGVLPFGCIFIQLFFILNSIWSNEVFYMFGFLFIVYMILLIVCAEVTILICYIRLRAEDYRWWWTSFLASGFSGFYVFIYSLHYLHVKLTITDLASKFLFVGYTLTAALLFSLLTGAVGYLACFYFVCKIYGAIKVD